MKNRIFITGYFGFGNTGDEAILMAMLSGLRALRPGLRIAVTSARPAETAAAYGVEAVLWSDILAIIEAVRISDLVVIGGGGLFHDYWGFDPGAFLTDNHSGIGFYTGPAVLGALHGKKVMLYAVGAGPLWSRQGERFTRVACEMARTVTVRDNGSRQLLESIGVPPSKIEVTADPAFCFVPGDEPVPEIPAGEPPLIGIAVRHWDLGISGAFWEGEIAAALDSFLSRHAGSAVFVPFQHLPGAREDDSEIARRIHGRMRNQDRAVVLPAPLSPSQVCRLLGRCDLIVGMRLHSLIFGILAGVPVVAISYDPKDEQLIRRAGLDPWLLPLRDIEASALTRMLEQAVEAAPALRPAIAAQAAALTALAGTNAARAIELLEREDWQPAAAGADAIEMLNRGFLSQVRETHALRRETRRLLGEVEFYHQQSVSESQRHQETLRLFEERERELQRVFKEFEFWRAQSQTHDEAAEHLRSRIQQLENDKLAQHAEQQRVFQEFEFWRAQSQTHLEAAERLRARVRELESDIVSQHAEHQRVFEEFEFWRNESTTHAARAGQAAAELADSRRRLDELQGELSTLAAKARLAAGERHAMEQNLAAAEARCTALVSGPLRQSAEEVERAELVRQATVQSLDRFQHEFQRALQSCRDQRAWQVMLLCRKAYVMLVRQGWSGRFAFARYLLSIPFSGWGRLADFDLTFPSVWNYVPDKLDRPLQQALPPAAAQLAPAPAVAAETVAALLPARKYDVVIFAIFDFDFRFQRPQQIAAQFARLGHRVFWISPARMLDPGDRRAYEAIPLRENLWEIHLRARRQDVYAGELDPADAAAVFESVWRLYADFAIAESCAMLQFPFWRQVGLSLRDRFDACLVYDCMDDWQNWTMEPLPSRFNLGEEQKLAREAAVMIVTSQEFLERQQAKGLHPVLARNAADFDFFRSPRPADHLAGLPRPVIGYYGAISDWFDRELLHEVARARPQYTFVLIGQVHGVDASKLASLANVRLLGEKNYREIPLYLSQFDVCLIPFLLNKLTKGVDPVKLYEYFSQGKPVVATDMPELPSDTGLLYIGTSAADFAAKVDLAVREDDPARRRQRIEFARANCWAARVEAISNAIEAAFPRVSILVVTYNSEEFLAPCLDSIERNTSWPNYEVVVVDNASKDRTPRILDEYAARDARIRPVLPGRNTGFAGGNNIAARHSTGEWLVFLNADTIVTPGWLGRMIRHCRRDPKIGLVAAVTNFSGNETKINIDYSNLSEMQEFALRVAAENEGRQYDLAVAALYCVLMPRPVWNEIGELDEGYRIGMFEDDDLSLRVRRAGYRVIAADDAFIHHFGNGSFAQVPSEESLRIFADNRKRFESKWGIEWQEHELRPRVRPPYQEKRLPPAEFLKCAPVAAAQAPVAPILEALHPGHALATGFNVQPDGQSALSVTCQNASPGTVIIMDGAMLQTSFGNPRLLTALVPASLCQRPGRHPVCLLNDFGESNRLDLVIEGSGEPPAPNGSARRDAATRGDSANLANALSDSPE